MKHLLLLATLALAPLTAHAAAPQPVDTMVPSTTPKEVYGPPGAPIRLRLGNGGAGPTGLLRALAEDFLAMEEASYAIAWYQNISRLTLEALKNGTIDMALTYERDQEDVYLQEGTATERTLVFNDHFVIVGPASNPAHVTPGDKAATIFAKVARQGEAQGAPAFLSRDDGSATHCKEQTIWEQAGRAPWNVPSAWYVRHTVFPRDALVEANNRSLYTIIDRGTWTSTRPRLNDAVLYGQGGEQLRNPCHALLQAHPTALAQAFLAYLKSPRGQQVVANFGRTDHGEPLFTPADQPDF